MPPKAAGLRAAVQNLCRGSRRSRMLRAAALSLGCNLLYALYNGILGALHLSLWFFTMFAFYGILAVMRFSAVLCFRRVETGVDTERFVEQISGVLLILLSVVLARVNQLSLSQDIAAKYGTIPMIAIAAYTFYKLIRTICNAVRQRRSPSRLLSVLCSIGCAEAAAAMLTLQRSMLVSFDGMDAAGQRQMNALTGAAACFVILGLGIVRIHHARTE